MALETLSCLVGEALSCRRGYRLLFDGLAVRAATGTPLLVTGPNGTGKSSLLRILAGLLSPSAGQVRLERADGGATIEAPREHVHYLGHEDAVKASLSVEANLAFWRAVLGESGLGVGDALERVGLGGLGRLPAGVLSAGQKRRLALARLLATRRPVWILDEPTTALDAAAQAMFAGFARAHLADGGILVAATHAPLDLGAGDELRLGRPGAHP